MTNDTLDFVTQKLLDQAKLMGADEADVIATKGQSLNVDVRQGLWKMLIEPKVQRWVCLLYTSDAADDA